MSAAVGHVIVSADAITSRERFIRDRTVNIFCFRIIDHIAKQLNKGPRRFFVKGGAAATLSLTGNPLLIENDIDCALLVDPSLAPDDFEKRRIHAAEISVKSIVYTLRSLAKLVSQDIQRVCLHYGLAPLSTSPPIRVGRAAPDGYALRESLTAFIAREKLELKPECPFSIDVWPSLIFQGTSLQMAVIKLRTHTEPSLDLLDIALPAKTYERLPYEWENYMIDPITVHTMRIPILSPYAQIENQAYAESKTVRGTSAAYNAKGNRRRTRIGALTAKFKPSSDAPVAAAEAAAGGAGAAAPGYSLPVAHFVARRNNTTRRNNRAVRTLSTSTIPMGPKLEFTGPRPNPNAERRLRRGAVVHAIHPTDVARGTPLGKPPRYAFIRRNTLPNGSNVRLFEAVNRVPRQYLYLGPDGQFYPLGPDAVLF